MPSPILYDQMSYQDALRVAKLKPGASVKVKLHTGKTVLVKGK